MINIIAFALFVWNMNVNAQSVPPNTRLMQLNTIKGSALSIVESSDNFIYHIGTSNSGEIGIDGLSSTSVGSDDLFIVKSNATTGSNMWLKTFNAGSNGVITPRYVSIDSAENIYLYGQFSGTITAGSNSITATSTSSSFLMKINSNGSAVWVNLLAGGNNSGFPKIKCVSDGADTFLVYNQNHLVRINDVTGDMLFDNVYAGAELKSVGLKDSNLYVAGASINSGLIFGTEVINSANTGFLLKGDKNAAFVASAVVALNSDPNYAGSRTDVSDIAVVGDGNILLSGFSKGSTNIASETGNYTYTYNPNGSFVNNRIYNYAAKIDSNLNTVYFLKSSTPVSSDYSYGIQTRIINSVVKPYGTVGNFKLLLTNNYFDGRSTINSFTNANSTSTTITQASAGGNTYKLVLSFDASGNFLTANQAFSNGMVSTSGTNYSLSPLQNRLFTTTSYNATSGAAIWTKTKSSAMGGSLSTSYQHHLNSAKNDMFFTSLAEGQSNFFSRKINNNPGIYSKYVTRLGVDGLPKWFASFYPDAGTRELNVSNDAACVDSNDNFIFLANTSGATSTFTDASGNFTDFNQNAAVSAKALIKLDKNGNMLWSKQILPAQAAKINAAVTADANGDVHVLGITDKNFSIDGTTVTAAGSNSIFLLKFSAAGALLYAKSYQNVGAYSLLPVFDAQNDLYVFSEPINYQGADYIFDGVTVPTNTDNLDHLMLKFSSAGNVIWAKNFYRNGSPDLQAYSWPNDVVFDGNNFIMMGNYYTSTSKNYLGLDMVDVPRVYSAGTYIPFFAKIKTDGSVLWQKPVHTNISNSGNYTNIDLDADKNIYMYWYAKDKMSLNGTEYSFDSSAGNKILMKLDTDGNLKYTKSVDINNISYPMIDVFGNDKLNISGFTTSKTFLNYPVNYNIASSLYIATFGDVDVKYLTPTKEYLMLNNITIDNNPNNANTFSFDLINNVNWSANSDNVWLNLSFQSLTGKYNFQSLITGSGDAKIIMSADTNNTGANRTANVMVSGDSGVSPKTIAITQPAATLGVGSAKTFVTTLYPNPTSDVLNIETLQKVFKIEIFDMSGKLLKTADGKDKQVSVARLHSGLYFIKLYTDNGIVNSKFIKN